LEEEDPAPNVSNGCDKNHVNDTDEEN